MCSEGQVVRHTHTHYLGYAQSESHLQLEIVVHLLVFTWVITVRIHDSYYSLLCYFGS